MRVLKALIKWTVVLLVVCGVGWTIWNAVASYRLEQAIEAASAAGWMGTIEELERGLEQFGGAPEPEENAAPLFRAVFAFMEGLPEPEDWTGEDRHSVPAEVENLIGEYEEVFALLERARSRPRCKFDLEWREGAAMRMNHLFPVRRAVLMCRARAILRVNAGDHEGAIEDLRLGFAVANALREEPILISQLVRIAAASIVTDALQHVLPLCPEPVEAVESLQTGDFRGAMAFSLHGEGPAFLMMLPEAKARDVVQLLFEWHWDDDWSAIAGGALVAVCRPYLKQQTALLLDLYGEYEVAHRLPYPEAREYFQRQRDRTRPAGWVLDPIAGSYMSVIDQEAKLVSELTLVRLAAKLLQHRNEYGDYPESIDAIAAAPLDPLSGRPFQWLEETGHWVLRSPDEELKVSWSLPLE